MKRLELSRLMDEYQDNEFFPEGGSAVDAQGVKDRVLAEAKAAPAKRRRVPPLKVALLAAALAVVGMLMIAAGLPGIFTVAPTGTQITQEDGRLHLDYTQHNDYWLLAEDGRFYLNLDGKRVEITGRFDADTPYIHTVQDASGITFYYVVGGTPDNYGFTEFEIIPDNCRSEIMPHNTFVKFDAQGDPLLERNMNLRDQNGNLLCPSTIRLSDFDDSYRTYPCEDGTVLEWHWYTAACDQLGFKGFFDS